MEVDQAQSKLGRYGKYQMRLFVVIAMATSVPGCWHMLAYFFHGMIPEHHCKIPEDIAAAAATNQSLIPYDETDPSVSQCYVYSNISISNATVKCSDIYNKWEYHGDVTKTVVSQWDLVCDRSYLVKLSQSVLVFGVMAGAMVFSVLADMFGRKPIFLQCQWALVAVGVANAYVSNHYAYLVLRFLTGFFQQGIIIIGTIMVCELFPATERSFAGIIIEDFWAPAHCLLALLSYLITDWSHLQLLISLSGLLTIPLYWVLPESVPWLCANDSYHEAEAILEKAARINGVSLPKNILTKGVAGQSTVSNGVEVKNKSENFITRYKRLQVKRKGTKDEDRETVQYTVLDIVRHKILATHAVVMGLIWLVITYVYYGITLNTKDLAGNRYLNFFLTGIVEIPAYTASFFIIKTWGRRLPLFGFHVLAGVSLMISVFIPDSAGDVNLSPLKIVFVMIGKFGITAAFGIVFLYSPELFPTTLRSQGTGISSFSGRIGNMIAPFATALDVYAPWLSAVVFGSASIIGGLLVLILPETLNRPLPQSIEEIENWTNKRSIRPRSYKKPTTPVETQLQTLDDDSSSSDQENHKEG